MDHSSFLLELQRRKLLDLAIFRMQQLQILAK
jgi:hypothetical protein